MFDAHTHLNSDKLYPKRKQYLLDFIQSWGTHLVSIWIDDLHNSRNIEICKQRNQHSNTNKCVVKATVWIHPCSVWDSNYHSINTIATQLTNLETQITEYKNYVVAVWECWIDAHRWDYKSIKKLQRHTFEQQCLLAQRYQLPIVVHSRSQRSDTIAILEWFKDLKIYLHCRWYTSQEIQEASQKLPHLRIWFCGNTTYPKAHNLRDSLVTARQLQHEWWCKVVVETDAPYLAPQSHRWMMNSPALLAESIQAFWKILWTAPDLLIEKTTRNTILLYDL